MGNREGAFYQLLLASQGVEVFDSTIELIASPKRAGLKVGVFSASRHAEQVLAEAGVIALFDAKVDGVDADELGLRGKPHPDTLIELARRLNTEPMRYAVVEEAIAGVQAGRAGGFALVISVNRSSEPGALLNAGAEVGSGRFRGAPP